MQPITTVSNNIVSSLITPFDNIDSSLEHHFVKVNNVAGRNITGYHDTRTGIKKACLVARGNRSNVVLKTTVDGDFLHHSLTGNGSMMTWPMESTANHTDMVALAENLLLQMGGVNAGAGNYSPL